MEISDNVFDINLMKRGLQGMTVVNYVIDTLGNLSSARVVQSIDRDMLQWIDRSMRSLPGKFLPAIIAGKPVESSIFVRVNLEESNYAHEKPSELPSSLYVYDIRLMYYKTTTVRKVERRGAATAW
ncbi:energy transducer TonB [Draconibacterium halophilum]|uniref:TonB C-terminal domain-containing protein n=1 Tax=Draconibacterium halophilum TaxID=2706887 RepID=A0A6C0RE96_9BACT|nr:energy transducer TonB [Draconibacterium halophilum]QIA07833.1 hypothetical protein G0Q07_08875 [Draconibacterium halophilum]